MTRSPWISYLFSIAFAMSVAHAVTPHAHSKGGEACHTNTASDTCTPHEDFHAQSHKPSAPLPVVAHFANADFIRSVKYSYPAKQHPVTEVHSPVFSVALPFLMRQPVPLPDTRDLPDKIIGSIQLLRAPPHVFCAARKIFRNHISPVSELLTFSNDPWHLLLHQARIKNE